MLGVIESDQIRAVPVLSVEQLNRAAVRMSGTYRGAFDYREPAQRHYVIGYNSVRSEIVRVVVLRIHQRDDRPPAQKLPTPLQNTAGEAEKILQRQIGTQHRI